MKKWSVWLICLMVAVLMIAGMGAIAAEYGGKDDPLVTLSYIEEVLLPKTKEDVDEQIADAVEDLEESMEDSNGDIEDYIDKKLRSFASGDMDDDLIEAIAETIVDQQDGNVSAAELSWAVVQVPAGCTVFCEVGVQAILREGQAVCVAAGTPGLIDLSNGESLENGGALVMNHLYTASLQDRGLYSPQGCTLLIAGSYTIQ